MLFVCHLNRSNNWTFIYLFYKTATALSSPLKNQNRSPFRKSSTATTPGKGKTPKTPGAAGAEGYSVTKSGKKVRTPSKAVLEDRFVFMSICF